MILLTVYQSDIKIYIAQQNHTQARNHGEFEYDIGFFVSCTPENTSEK